MDKEVQKKQTFKNCDNYLDKSHDFIVLGIPSDYGSTQTRGFTLNAPEKIRILSDDLAYSTESGVFFSPENIRLGDIGDLNDHLGINLEDFNKFSVSKLNNSISDYFKEIYEKNQDIIPITLGGNHYITYPVFSSIKNRYKDEDILFISFDAHIDYYDDWELKHFYHCTVTKRIFDLKGMGVEHVYVFGSRDNDIAEIELANRDNLKFFTINDYLESNLEFSNYLTQKLKSIKKGQKIYISLDIDVFDPSVAPATGYPVPGGLSYREIHQSMEFLAENFQIIGFDIVEYQPNLDLKNKMTGFLCVKLITEVMMMIKRSKN